MVTIKKKRVISFIESFIYIKSTSKHGRVSYNIYNKDKKQLNSRPILITGDKKNEYGDTGTKLLADSFGIGQQFLKQLLNGEKTIKDYEKEILIKKSNR
ncbi:MAG: hypothetical protein L6405_09310 [Actinomycetia bacterium]|nr:hypothetical protein [Actinomycetes bacterium]